MNSVAIASEANRQALFSQVSVRCGLSPAIVEKDFWVCWMLDYLFSRSPWKTQLAFKGGTSLSKAYGLIKRFSEDIDLILDWRLLGYGIREPWEKRSKRTFSYRASRPILKRILVEIWTLRWTSTIRTRLSSVIHAHFRMCRSCARFGWKAVALASLPGVHHDPFDRMLIAQAQAEGVKFISHDDRVIACGDSVVGV